MIGFVLGIIVTFVVLGLFDVTPTQILQNLRKRSVPLTVLSWEPIGFGHWEARLSDGRVVRGRSCIWNHYPSGTSVSIAEGLWLSDRLQGHMWQLDRQKEPGASS